MVFYSSVVSVEIGWDMNLTRNQHIAKVLIHQSVTSVTKETHLVPSSQAGIRI